MADLETITLDKYTPLNYLLIWEPRWHDKRVLLSKDKLGTYNKVVITQAKTSGERYFPEPLYISGKDARKYPLESNGTIMCHAVPISAFKILKLSKRSMMEL